MGSSFRLCRSPEVEVVKDGTGVGAGVGALRSSPSPSSSTPCMSKCNRPRVRSRGCPEVLDCPAPTESRCEMRLLPVYSGMSRVKVQRK